MEDEDSGVEWKMTKHQANQEKVKVFNEAFLEHLKNQFRNELREESYYQDRSLMDHFLIESLNWGFKKAQLTKEEAKMSPLAMMQPAIFATILELGKKGSEGRLDIIRYIEGMRDPKITKKLANPEYVKEQKEKFLDIFFEEQKDHYKKMAAKLPPEKKISDVVYYGRPAFVAFTAEPTEEEKKEAFNSQTTIQMGREEILSELKQTKVHAENETLVTIPITELVDVDVLLNTTVGQAVQFLDEQEKEARARIDKE
jgi:hypothetical protein